MNGGVMTIDDFPSANSPAMVDYFRSREIRVVFFATGENLARCFDEAVHAVRNGMIVGNHSCSHPGFSSLTLEEAIDEIGRCERLLERLYQESGVTRPCRLFRFPYGDKGGDNRDAIQQYLRAQGFRRLDDTHIDYPWWRQGGREADADTFWTFDFEEYALYQRPGLTKDFVWRKMDDPSPAMGAALFAPGNRHILLMHDHEETEAVLPGYYRLFTEYLLEKGFVFETPRFI